MGCKGIENRLKNNEKRVFFFECIKLSSFICRNVLHFIAELLSLCKIFP